MVREQKIRQDTTLEPKEDWVATKSLDNECITEFGKELLDSPVFCISTTFGASTQLYTKEQMLEMFRYGYSLFQKPYTFMHKMGVKDTVLFPIENWASVRSAASILKRQFGAVYKVEKVILSKASKSSSVIKVTRKS